MCRDWELLLEVSLEDSWMDEENDTDTGAATTLACHGIRSTLVIASEHPLEAASHVVASSPVGRARLRSPHSA